MTILAKDVLKRAGSLLFDESAVRWPYVELLDWLNDALKEITLRAPQAVSKLVVLDMVAGTQQTLPDAYLSLLRVNCNVTAVGQVISARKGTVRPIQRAALDHQIPNWQSTTTLPFTVDVSHIIDDEANSRNFLVAPGNTGTGRVEALVASRPAVIPTPANPLELASYTTAIEIDDIYQSALVDFVMSKALTKDTNVQGGAQRAVAHYQQFAGALGIKLQADQAINPNTGMTSKGG